MNLKRKSLILSKKYPFGLWFFLLLIFFGSCTKDERGLTAEQRYMLDTLYNSGLVEVRRKADSICAVQRDSVYLSAVDSIKQEYLEVLDQYFGKEVEGDGK